MKKVQVWNWLVGISIVLWVVIVGVGYWVISTLLSAGVNILTLIERAFS